MGHIFIRFHTDFVFGKAYLAVDAIHRGFTVEVLAGQIGMHRTGAAQNDEYPNDAPNPCLDLEINHEKRVPTRQPWVKMSNPSGSSQPAG